MSKNQFWNQKQRTCLVNKGLSDILDVPRGSTSSKYHEISPVVVLRSWNYLDVVSLNVRKNLLDFLQIEDATVKGGGGQRGKPQLPWLKKRTRGTTSSSSQNCPHWKRDFIVFLFEDVWLTNKNASFRFKIDSI